MQIIRISLHLHSDMYWSYLVLCYVLCFTNDREAFKPKRTVKKTRKYSTQKLSMILKRIERKWNDWFDILKPILLMPRKHTRLLFLVFFWCLMKELFGKVAVIAILQYRNFVPMFSVRSHGSWMHMHHLKLTNLYVICFILFASNFNSVNLSWFMWLSGSFLVEKQHLHHVYYLLITYYPRE